MLLLIGSDYFEILLSLRRKTSSHWKPLAVSLSSILNVKYKEKPQNPEISRYWLQLMTRKDRMKVIVKREDPQACQCKAEK